MSSFLLFVKPDAKLTDAPFKILLDVCQSENSFITFQSSLKDEILFHQQITNSLSVRLDNGFASDGSPFSGFRPSIQFSGIPMAEYSMYCK